MFLSVSVPPPIGHFKYTIRTSNQMGPEAKVLLFYMRDDGEVVATTAAFQVQRCLDNKVAIVSIVVKYAKITFSKQ